MERSRIKALLEADAARDPVLVKGWVRTKREAAGFSFIEVNDGSCLRGLQIIADKALENYDDIKKLTTGSAIAVGGALAASLGSGQKWDLQASTVEIIGRADDTYPLQKKRHTDEYLRTIAHLRPRTNKYGATFRLRSELSFAIHDFFREKGFKYIHTPILTGSDCEGAGELFRVTSLDLENIPKVDGRTDASKDFFGQEANLTVSGQLAVEMFALSLGDVYTFGPTFRAENSNTRRHAAEFWMVEPEMAFADLADDMCLAEDMIQYLIRTMMDRCSEDLDLFARFVDKTLLSTLENIATTRFVRIPYAEAITILEKSGKSFQYEIRFGKDLQSEHERFLTEDHFKAPVIVHDYPKTIKPFYMRANDDNETVAAMDVLVPRIGEIIGGSQREERLDLLSSRLDAAGLSLEKYAWYLDSRRYGTAPHSGFGLGFERLLMLITGITNIRDVIPFSRTPGSIDF
ncbi:MAG: asparagine--tRNA ligase [Desulfobacterales bacterium]